MLPVARVSGRTELEIESLIDIDEDLEILRGKESRGRGGKEAKVAIAFVELGMTRWCFSFFPFP